MNGEARKDNEMFTKSMPSARDSKKFISRCLCWREGVKAGPELAGCSAGLNAKQDAGLCSKMIVNLKSATRGR